jgi:arylsulfatase A
MKKTFLLLYSLLLAMVCFAQTTSSKPNIIIILADDLGYGDLKCYNPERGKIATPQIDKLASQSMRFTDGHSSSGVCSPSRYALLTGRYHWRTRLQAGIVDVFGAPLIAPERMTIGTLAKQKGYQTAAIGKWHLGWEWPISKEQKSLLQPPKKANKDDASKPKRVPDVATEKQVEAWSGFFSKPIAAGPTTRGFNTYFGTDVPNWPPYCFIENDHTVGVPSEFLPIADIGNNLASIQGPALKDWKLDNILPALAQHAEAFIADAAKHPEPFLLYLALTAPHTPLSPIDGWKNKSGLNTYADFVMQTDATVGRLLDVLEKSGAAGNTLVIFTSDNGCAPYIGADVLEQKGHYPSGSLRGYKSDAWEGGHRVPFIVRWPGIVKPGSLCNQLVEQADIFSTLAEILGRKLPDDAGEDSFSMLPLFKGKEKPTRGNAVSTSSNGLPAVRQGKWKYIPGPGSGGWGKGGDQSQPVQLYNLEKDLSETNNLAASMPKKVEEMIKYKVNGRVDETISITVRLVCSEVPRSPCNKSIT